MFSVQFSDYQTDIDFKDTALGSQRLRKELAMGLKWPIMVSVFVLKLKALGSFFFFNGASEKLSLSYMFIWISKFTKVTKII